MKLAVAILLSLVCVSWAVAESESAQTMSRSQSIAALMERTKVEQEVKTLGAAKAEPSQPAPLQMMKALAFTAGLFLIGVGLYRRMHKKTGFSSKRRIVVIERTPITPKTSLILAQVEGQRVLLAVGGEQVSQISGVQQTISLSSDLALPDEGSELRIACND